METWESSFSMTARHQSFPSMTPEKKRKNEMLTTKTDSKSNMASYLIRTSSTNIASHLTTRRNYLDMASLPQNSSLLMNSNKNYLQPHTLNKKTHTGNLAAQFQGRKHTFGALALEEQTREKGKATIIRCSDDGSCGVVPEFLPRPSLEETIQDFYVAFHESDTQRLEDMLAPQCLYMDMVFYGFHEGREEVTNFLKAVREAMGNSIHIFIEDIKTEHLTVTVRLHLRWKDYKIPFTSGFRHFTFEKEDGRLVICKITGVEDLPVNPAELSLKLMKAIGALCDRYPMAAEMMLKAYSAEEGKHTDMHFDIFGHKN